MDTLSIEVPSLRGHFYVLVVVDDHSGATWVFPLTRKSEVYTVVCSLLATMARQFPDSPVQIIRSDRGGEFGNPEFACTQLMEHLAGLGIQQQFSTTQSPQQNGRAERPIQILSNTMRTILWASKHPKAFWAEALKVACSLAALSSSRPRDSLLRLPWHAARSVKDPHLGVCRGSPAISEEAGQKSAQGFSRRLFTAFKGLAGLRAFSLSHH
jgi:transposase InsO family protein